MMTQLALAVRDVRRKPVAFVLLAIQLVVPLFFGSISLDHFSSTMRSIRHATQLADDQIVFFSPNIASVQLRRVSREAALLLATSLDEARRGYSVVESVKLRDYPSLNVVVGVGAFDEVIGLGHIAAASHPAVVLIGHRVDSLQVGHNVNFGEVYTTKLPVSGRLAPGTSYSLRGIPRNLDDSLVVLTDVESMLGHFFHEWVHYQEIILNTHLLAPNSSELRYFVSRIRNETGFALNPKDLISSVSRLHGDFYAALFFLVFFGITGLFVLFGIVANVTHHLDSQTAEYAIHLLSGARMWQLYSRVVFYILLLVGPPVFAVALVLIGMYQVPLSTLMAVLPPFLGLVILLAASPVLQLRRTDLFSFLRSDDKWH